MTIHLVAERCTGVLLSTKYFANFWFMWFPAPAYVAIRRGFSFLQNINVAERVRAKCYDCEHRGASASLSQHMQRNVMAVWICIARVDSRIAIIRIGQAYCSFTWSYVAGTLRF
ncbi:hypothetical protein CRJUMX02_2000008 [Escherichia coli]|nr:hypothetical protein CRJUMX02_2000008 [Escherichia coli]